MDPFDVLLIPLCAAIAVCVGVLRARTRLLIGLFLAVPLWYVSVAGFTIPLYVVWMLLCLPAALLGFRGNPEMRGFGIAVAGIAMLYAVYAPFAVDGRQSVYLGAFYLCLLTGLLDAGVAVRDDENLHSALRRISPLILLQCVLVVVFRIDPQLERQFLRSPLLSLSAGEVAARGLFRGSPNNVLDADKAGGLLVNGNTASMVMGVAACLALWQWSRSRRRFDMAVATVALVAVTFTGSKTGIVLAVATLVVIFFSRLLVRSAAVFAAVAVTVALCAAAAVLTVGDLSWTGDVRRESALTLGIRQHIWHAAWQFFESAPLTGLTPGGWERSFAAVAGAGGIGYVYPPHNFVIAAWAHVGLLGAVAVVVVSARWIQRAAAVLRQGRHRGRREVAGRAALVCGLAWPVIHGLGDNTSIYGDLHSQTFVALMVALTVTTTTGAGEGARDCADPRANSLSAVPR